MRLDNPSANSQSQAVAGLLGCEKWEEDLVADLGGDATAAVTDVDPLQFLTIAAVRTEPYGDWARRGTRMHGIFKQISKDSPHSPNVQAIPCCVAFHLDFQTKLSGRQCASPFLLKFAHGRLHQLADIAGDALQINRSRILADFIVIAFQVGERTTDSEPPGPAVQDSLPDPVPSNPGTP
jgi:hypothetical protein